MSDRANRRDGFLLSRSVLQGFADPKFHVSAIGPNGKRCGLSLNPREVTARTLSGYQILATSRDFAARTADARRALR